MDLADSLPLCTGFRENKPLASPGLPRPEKGRNPELIQSVYAFRDAQVLARIVVRS